MARPGTSPLAALHLFGKPQPAAAARRGPIEAPETHLALALHGVVAGEGEMAFAIIASRGGEERAYRVGESLASGAVLRDIYPDRVILDRNGHLETLKLPKESAAGALSPTLRRKLRGYRNRR